MIVWYITSHGFGHAVRSTLILARVDREIPVTLRTECPRWFLEQKLTGRPFELAPAAFDCGTLGPDATRIDLRRTLERAEELIARNERRIDEEVQWLRARGARLVVADIVPFALRVARRAGIPSILIANFTWAGIYRHLVEMEQPDEALRRRAAAVIEHMRAEYAEGDLLLTTGFVSDAEACRERREMPLVAAAGRPRRAELARARGLDPARPIYLVYLGREGLQGLEPDARPRLRDLQLVGYAAPAGLEELVRPLDEETMPTADAFASVDGVIGKAGYGTCAQCLAVGTRMLYLPRPQFAEWYALDRALRRWGGGLCIPERDFLRLDWRPWLERLGRQRIRQTPDCTGAERCAREIERAWREGLSGKEREGP